MRKKIFKLIITVAMVILITVPIIAQEIIQDIAQEVVQENSEMNIQRDIENKSISQGIHLQIGSELATVNGESYILDAYPKVIKGITVVPLRFISDALNVQVEWKKETKQIVISKEEQVVVLQLGESIARINGKQVPIGTAPIVENDRTLVPLRFISEQFQLDVIYTQENRTIDLIPLIPPVAQFRFGNDRYVAGQIVSAVNESYSPNGEKIVETLWEVNNNPGLRTKELSKIFTKPGAGTYSIKLRVRNEKNVWSEWAEQVITIEPHPNPVVTSFSPTNKEWAQGEEIKFTYNAQTEPWEKIVEERWTYRPIEKAGAKPTVGKPRAFFHEGTYVVTLEVKDSYGSWSAPVSTQIDITNKVKSTELEFKFNHLQYGDEIDNYGKFNFQKYEPVKEYAIQKGGPTLLISNSPETVIQKGVLYADEVYGQTRILYHHRNGLTNSSTNTRLIIVVENKGTEMATIQHLKQSSMGPSNDILHLGQQVALEYFNSNVNSTQVLEPNQKQYIYDTGSRKWAIDQTFSGMLEFSSDQPVHVTIAAVDESFALEQLESLSIAPRDGIHTRGTFEGANTYVGVVLPSDRPSKIMFGQANDDMDQWMSGYDALTGETVQNKGNYGVIYELSFRADEKTGILLNPRATSFKGALQWKNGKSYQVPDLGVLIGSQGAAIVGVVDANQTRQLYYTLPNGSSAPVLFTFIPERFWDNYEEIGIDK